MGVTRFDNSDAGRRRLGEALRRTPLFHHVPSTTDAAVAAVIEAVLPTIKTATTGATIIARGSQTNDLWFVLQGAVDIVINGSVVKRREAPTHVGEMALIDPTAPRSADVVAATDVEVGCISEAAFAKLAEAAPWMWRSLATEIGRRLRERSDLILAANHPPKLFVGSSKEGLSIAKALHRRLDREALDVRLWTVPDAFRLSLGTLEELERHGGEVDFAVLVLTPDDPRQLRGVDTKVARDNVVLELGLFVGALGRTRTFALTPAGGELALPSDFLGVTTLRYDATHRRPSVAVTGAARRIDEEVATFGPRVRVALSRHDPRVLNPQPGRR